ncbi:MAG TPA: O-antigen ligase family protein [Solirubrobacteraceae bacterium]|jgi:O-antigen ligase
MRARGALPLGGSESILPWILVAGVLGAGIGLAAALNQTTVAVVLVLLPGLFALLLRLDWIPVLLMATVFGEALQSGSVTASRAVAPLALFAVVLGLPGRTRVRLPRIGLLLAAIAYASWALASAAWTVNSDSSLTLGGTGYALAQLAISLALMGAMVMFVRFETDLRRLLWVTWLLASVTGLVSIAQYASGYGRAVGVSGDANFFAALQVVALPFSALLAIEVRNTRSRTIILIGIAIAVGSIITSLSRGGILALVAVFLLLSLQPARGFFHTRARKRAFLLFVSIGAGILLVASYSALSARTSSLFSGGDQGSGRANLWRAAVTGWHQHEIRGLGLGAFIGQSNKLLLETPRVNFSDYQLRSTGQYVHNAYLESLVELGVIGAALFVGLLVTMALSLRASARRAQAAGLLFSAAFSRALALALAGFAFTSIFLSTETDRTLWVLIGLAIALPRVISEEQLRREKPADAPVLPALAPQEAVPAT